MSQPTHFDLAQQLGEALALIGAIKERQGEIHGKFDQMSDDIAEMKARWRERAALERVALWIVGVIGAGLAWIGQAALGHFWK